MAAIKYFWYLLCEHFFAQAAVSVCAAAFFAFALISVLRPTFEYVCVCEYFPFFCTLMISGEREFFRLARFGYSFEPNSHPPRNAVFHMAFHVLYTPAACVSVYAKSGWHTHTHTHKHKYITQEHTNIQPNLLGYNFHVY